jgi:hypothetical protein
MADEDTNALAPAAPDDEARIPFKQFLETVHPSVERTVEGLWEASPVFSSNTPRRIELTTPDLRLHCERCDGERTFRCEGERQPSLSDDSANARLINYLCSDCRAQGKSFSLWVAVGKSYGTGVAYKYGELPPFGVPVPNKVLRLFGKDATIFLKGRQCENQSLGLGAFAYYRRVVENHKNDLFDEIVKVCETIPASEQLIGELRSAQKEVSFMKAIEQIKTTLPQGLLINGHNPLSALHRALSIGLHSESDATCLQTAHAVRLVLTDLVEKMSNLRQDNRELNSALQVLMAMKEGA